MAAGIASPELEIVIRFRDLMTKQLVKAERALQLFQEAASKGFGLATQAADKFRRVIMGLPALLGLLAGGAIAHFARAMISSASAAGETASRFQVAFEGIAEQAQATAEVISSEMGRSISDIQGSMADFSTLFASVGFGEEQALDASEALTQLSLDLSSFQDVSDERSTQALRSALLGEAEALKQLNIFVNEGNVRTALYKHGMAGMSEKDGWLTVLDLLTGEVKATIMLGNGPTGMGAARAR